MSLFSASHTVAVLAVAQGLLLGAGMCLCVLLFLWIKREVRAVVVESRQRAEAHEQILSGLRKELDEARAALAAAAAAAGVPRGRLDLTRRAQALRLYRQGQSAAQIASTLGLPRGEVELLLKIHRLRDAADSSETPRPAAWN
ncbi:MAG: DUF2802 domain-containing protein [Bryobacterales bacterium]|nr:DUF2802 domain-containing protein [Bryobacteraceae bacterium]MDW8355252.1 DUF2802 domain-containing protein [Bryobacterales bacterium]